MHTTTGRWHLGAALACTTTLVWGVLPLALKIVLEVLDATTIIWFRMGVSALLVGGLLAWRRRLPRLRALEGRGWALLAVAVGGIAANFWAFMVGLDLTSPGNAQVLSQLGPVLLALGGLVVFGERYRRLQWIGLGVLATGLVVFFSNQLGLLVTQLDRYLLGSAMIVLAAATWAAYGLTQKQLLRSLSAEGIMLCIYVGSFLAFSPLAAPSRVPEIPRLEMAVLLFCAVNTIVGYGAFSNALHHWEASRVSAVLSLTPLATLGFAELGERIAPSVVHSEPVSAWTIGGAVIVVAGSMLVALGGRRGA
ncbi:MAG: DMT family transporter [Deltaproteobacteria bacterium]|nr:DMT family transporter [Deltaproteobacteria bacterium]